MTYGLALRVPSMDFKKLQGDKFFAPTLFGVEWQGLGPDFGTINGLEFFL